MDRQELNQAIGAAENAMSYLRQALDRSDADARHVAGMAREALIYGAEQIARALVVDRRPEA